MATPVDAGKGSTEYSQCKKRTGVMPHVAFGPMHISLLIEYFTENTEYFTENN